MADGEWIQRSGENLSVLPLFRSSRSNDWLERYIDRVRWSDLAVVSVAVLAAEQLRFGVPDRLSSSAFVLTASLVFAWVVALRLSQSHDRRIVGNGPAEYNRVLAACFGVFGFLAIVDLVFKLGLARGYIAIALPLGTMGLLVSRWLWRRSLVRARRQRRNMHHVLVVGETRSAALLIAHIARNPTLGLEVVGLCVPMDSDKQCPLEEIVRVPIFGTFDSVRDAVERSGATTVAVSSAEALGHSAMRELSWSLEGMHVELLVSPGVIDVAGPRMTVRPVAGLPLLHIDKPRYEGGNRLLKGAFDRCGAFVLLVVLSPVLLWCALAVKVTSPGPIFYRSERMGLGSIPFQMWKFRTMVVGADSCVEDLTERNEGAGVLFKVRTDPRVTPTGKWLRRSSFDELPQLINVVLGSMSLVGPRPPLRTEVERYTGLTDRRMLVRPGMTGLWQISGRSDLSWDETVRLDLSYVENWSLMQDVIILWRTMGAVAKGAGAY